MTVKRRCVVLLARPFLLCDSFAGGKVVMKPQQPFMGSFFVWQCDNLQHIGSLDRIV